MYYLISVKMVEKARQAVSEMGFDLEKREEAEWDAGLGNGGLGRQASCCMDASACLDFPGYGYGIRYDRR
ncbi:MAG: glycogen/starch/alpha-glucan phosphorylase [Desulfosarcina sp.]|jgi:starch phosphorylase